MNSARELVFDARVRFPALILLLLLLLSLWRHLLATWILRRPVTSILSADLHSHLAKLLKLLIVENFRHSRIDLLLNLIELLSLVGREIQGGLKLGRHHLARPRLHSERQVSAKSILSGLQAGSTLTLSTLRAARATSTLPMPSTTLTSTESAGRNTLTAGAATESASLTTSTAPLPTATALREQLRLLIAKHIPSQIQSLQTRRRLREQ